MNKTTAWLVGLVVLNLVVLSVAVTGKPQVIREVVDNSIGAVSSPDIQSNYFSYGGVRHWAAKDGDLSDATTTVCALLSPAATSTLAGGSIKFTTGATTTQTVTIGKSATPYTVQTVIATSSATASEKITVLAATTTTLVDSANGRKVLTDRIFSPSTYLIVTLSDTNAYTDVEGNCQATWVEN